MIQLTIKTKHKDEVVDITDDIHRLLHGVNVASGVCTVFVQHTTAAITTADLDPGTDLDMLDALRAIAPKLHYRHPHDPSHVTDHILASMIGPSVSIPFDKKKLLLGTWQRVVLLEFDGPRERSICVMI